MQGLIVRKLADKSDGERVEVPVLEDVALSNGETVQVTTGRTKLVNPATPGTDHEPWPLEGIRLEQAPDECAVSTTFIDNAVQEGWAELKKPRLVRRPAGPADRPMSSYHTFMHADAVVFHTVDGDVKYKVVHQPDKYADYDEATHPNRVDGFDADDKTEVTGEMYAAGATRVDHFYVLSKGV